jgi:hypothetical protein
MHMAGVCSYALRPSPLPPISLKLVCYLPPPLLLGPLPHPIFIIVHVLVHIHPLFLIFSVRWVCWTINMSNYGVGPWNRFPRYLGPKIAFYWELMYNKKLPIGGVVYCIWPCTELDLGGCIH